jgi:hypothetical protein
MRFDRPRPLTAAQQLVGLRSNPACRGDGKLRSNILTWRCSIRPTLLSRAYSARIEYRPGKAPTVYIDEPDLLVLAGGRRLPHVYQQSPAQLCLYLPSSGEWGSWMRLDQTIIPWIALWLFYFEAWLLTEEWSGGGIHPMTRPKSDRRVPTGKSPINQRKVR